MPAAGSPPQRARATRHVRLAESSPALGRRLHGGLTRAASPHKVATRSSRLLSSVCVTGFAVVTDAAGSERTNYLPSWGRRSERVSVCRTRLSMSRADLRANLSLTGDCLASR